MNHFSAINLPQLPTITKSGHVPANYGPSSSDYNDIDNERKKRFNDEYIDSLQRFIRDVEIRKREHEQKASKNDPWSCLLKANVTTTTTNTDIPSADIPIIQMPKLITPHHKQNFDHVASLSLPSPPNMIDQKRRPLTTAPIPRRHRRRRRNLVVPLASLRKYCRKIQQTCHLRESSIPTKEEAPCYSGGPNWNDCHPNLDF